MMCDSDQPSALLPTPVRATYADLFTSHDQLIEERARHAGSTLILGNRGLGDPLGVATWADYERGALTRESLRRAVEEMHADLRGFVTVYHSADRATEVVHTLDGLTYWQWVAGWGNLDLRGSGHAVHQFLPYTALNVRCDLSVIRSPAWHPAPSTSPALALVHDRLLNARNRLNDALAVLAPGLT
jgi:hypothetical protein